MCFTKQKYALTVISMSWLIKMYSNFITCMNIKANKPMSRKKNANGSSCYTMPVRVTYF